ncbi:MAG: glycosyltransferase family 87 protein [Blastocatellia bacterium]
MKAKTSTLSYYLPRLVLPVMLLLNLANFASKIKWLSLSFADSKLCSRDFISVYLLAKSVLVGITPYLPLRELAAHWPDVAGCNTFIHPSPHPPALAVFFAPVGLLTYKSAVFLWLGLQLACLTAAVCLLMKWWGKELTPWRKFVVGAGFLSAGPVIYELRAGQLNSLLLVLLLLSWFSLRKEKDLIGGALLGAIVSLKLMIWPVIIYLLLRRRWVALVAAGLVITVTHVIAAFAIGASSVINYYLKAGPYVARFYRTDPQNVSVWTLGWRLFDQSGEPAAGQTFYPALWEAPFLVELTTYAVPTALTAIVLAVALRARLFDTAFAELICVSLLVNPVAWYHYLVIAFIPVAIAARRLQQLGLPTGLTLLGGALFLIQTRGAVLSLLGLIWLLWKLDRTDM